MLFTTCSLLVLYGDYGLTVFSPHALIRAFLKGDLLFDRTRARVRRKPSSRRSGINPGENLDNGREELAFPAPVKAGLFINDEI